MRLNEPIGELVDGLLVTAEALVLQRRELLQPADPRSLSRFGDDRWDLSPIFTDRHTSLRTVVWHGFPVRLRESCKFYAFALLNVIDDAPRLKNARSLVPHPKTVLQDLGYLRVFTRWMDRQGLASFAAVTAADLDRYLRFVTDQHGDKGENWRRSSINVVQRLHAYRWVLPETCRLPIDQLWGGISAAKLVNSPGPRFGENRTPRIHPDTISTLLSAALFTIDTIAGDLLPVVERLLRLRQLAESVAPPAHRHRTRSNPGNRGSIINDHLQALLPAMAARALPLPGITSGSQVKIDLEGFVVGGWLDLHIMRRMNRMAILDRSGLPVIPDLFRITKFTSTTTGPWRSDPIGAYELAPLLRLVTAACFIVIAYLSGARTGEVLNLRRGCSSYDEKLDMFFLSGEALKTRPDRRERSLRTVPWVVTSQVAAAVEVLETISISDLLFPAKKAWSTARFAADEHSHRSRTPGKINVDITDFICWFNDAVAPAIGHPVIEADPEGPITAPRLRRTLAWHIVRRPGGTVAGATQYGHVHTQITHGYAGNASSGFIDEIAFEEFLMRAEHIHKDHERLTSGELVSGPAASSYQQRVTDSRQFLGLTLTTRRQVDKVLSNPALQIHHGKLLTCVYKPETAACRTTGAETKPTWSRCRATCQNIAYTDRDIEAVGAKAVELKAELCQDILPLPLRQRLQARFDHYTQVLAMHHTKSQIQQLGKGIC